MSASVQHGLLIKYYLYYNIMMTINVWNDCANVHIIAINILYLYYNNRHDTSNGQVELFKELEIINYCGNCKKKGSSI